MPPTRPQISFEFSILNFEFPPTLPHKGTTSKSGWVGPGSADSACRLGKEAGLLPIDS